ncbi:hypothetical protein ACH42_10270 [Endozoicomonas sp. (ex Bugula neritina AB1)]|nr:hypothetical protein ACH42_10270 [Endozoicomonas sp. (ex Bugula neritina AB1)]
MRFAEVLNITPTNKLVNINDSVYEQLVDHWTKDIGATKLFGYMKKTRVEYFQEAVDTVYTALEAELQTADPRKIMSHSKWTLLVGCAKRNFPEHISVYQPSPLEQTRVKRMVRNTLATRIITNKIDLLDIIKKDKCDSVWTIGELAVSRLRYELLAASAARVHDRYMNELDSDWSTWYDWNLRKPDWSYARGRIETTSNTSKAGAEAKRSFSGTGEAGISLDKSWDNKGRSQALKGNLLAKGTVSGHGSADAKMDELRMSAEAGIEAEASLRADFDYEMKYSCKVKGGYLRRLLGAEVDVLKGHVSGSAEVLAKASVSASATARLSKPKDEKGVEIKIAGEEEEANPSRGFSGSAEGEVSLAVIMKGHASVAIAQAAEIELGGDLFAGGKASGELQCFINGKGVGIDIGGQLFAGFEIGTEQKVSLTHPGRGVHIFSLKARETLSCGVGVSGKLAAKATMDEVSFDVEAGATLGVGSSLEAGGLLSPRGLMLVGYDAIAMPAIYQLAQAMQRFNPGSVHTDRLVTFSQYLNRQASKAELSQVYLDCRGRMVSLVSNLDLEADSVQKRAARIPGFNGYGDVMGIAEIDAVEGFVGNSKSKYFQYANEEIKLDDGTVLESVSVKGDRKDQVVTDDKKALLKAAQDYAGQKKIMRSGECIAFDVIKKDIKSGVVTL